MLMLLRLVMTLLREAKLVEIVMGEDQGLIKM